MPAALGNRTGSPSRPVASVNVGDHSDERSDGSSVREEPSAYYLTVSVR